MAFTYFLTIVIIRNFVRHRIGCYG